MRPFQILSVLILLTFASQVHAQQTSPRSFIISPAKEINVEAKVDGLTIFDIFQENVDTIPISLGWRLLQIALPPQWDYSMCELGRCYAGIPDSSQMDEVPPHEKAFLGVNIIPNGVPGIGTVQCVVFDVRYPESRDTLTWNVTAGSASVASNSKTELPSVFPNPSDGMFSISLVKNVSGNVRIFDAVGKEIRSFRVHGTSIQVDLTGRASGTYTLLFEGNDGSVLRQRFIKR